MRSIPWILAALMFSLLTWVPVEAQVKKPDPARQVQDDASLFSKEAKEKANSIIARIKSQSHKDFFVETVPVLPIPKDIDHKDTVAVNKFMAKWAAEKFVNLHIDGVYVVITDDPKKLEIEVGKKTLDEGRFTKDDRSHLREILIGDLKQHDPNKALVEAANYVQETLAKHPPAGAVTNHKPADQPVDPKPARQPQADGIPTWVIWVGVGLGALLIFWLIMGLARAATGGGGGRGYGGAPGMGGGGGGGGGFMSSMLGGLFGAAAGMYLYNNFFGGHGSSAQAGDSYSGAGGGNSQESTDVGAGDPSGDGGDWGGDAGGGGDVGGGDVGGGDWGGGGGDAGGGGDFGGGGGGGDW